MTIEKPRVVLLGLGDVARHSYLPGLDRLRKQGKIEWLGVCDVVASRVERACAEYNLTGGFTDFDKCLEAVDFDLLVNITPATLHYEVVKRALTAHRHVYTEKPLALSLAEADELIALAQANGVVLASAPSVMIHELHGEARRWVQEGVIGKVCFARAHGSHGGPERMVNYLTDPSWFYRKGGGPLLDLGIYPLHVITGLMGPARRVTALAGVAMAERQAVAGEARGKAIRVEIPDNYAVSLDFGDGRFVQIDSSFCVLSYKGPYLELYGTDGVLYLNAESDRPPLELFLWNREHEVRGWLRPEPLFRGHYTPAEPVEPSPGANYGLISGVEHVIDVLSTGAPLILTAEHARHVLEIALAAELSAETGRVVDISSTF